MPADYFILYACGRIKWVRIVLGKIEMIGCTNINIVERWDFDPPGTRTTFEMVLNESTLVLERPGDSRLVFRKLPRLPFPGDAAEALESPGRAGDGR